MKVSLLCYLPLVFVSLWVCVSGFWFLQSKSVSVFGSFQRNEWRACVCGRQASGLSDRWCLGIHLSLWAFVALSWAEWNSVRFPHRRLRREAQSRCTVPDLQRRLYSTNWCFSSSVPPLEPEGIVRHVDEYVYSLPLWRLDAPTDPTLMPVH